MAWCTPDPQQRGFADQDGVAPAGKGAGWIPPAPWHDAHRILSSGFRTGPWRAHTGNPAGEFPRRLMPCSTPEVSSGDSHGARHEPHRNTGNGVPTPAHAMHTPEHRQRSSHAGSCHSHTGTPTAEFPRRLMPFAHANPGSGVHTPANAMRTPEHRQRSFRTAHGVAHARTPAAEFPCRHAILHEGKRAAKSRIATRHAACEPAAHRSPCPGGSIRPSPYEHRKEKP